MNDAQLMPNQLPGFLRLQLIPVSKATWWNGCMSGQSPKPHKLEPRITAWKSSDIQNCIDKFTLTDSAQLLYSW